MIEDLKKAVQIIRKAKYAVVFTGAGISVESGIAPFRGKNGIWSKHNPMFFEIDFFKKKPFQSWQKMKELFYDSIDDYKPNIAHTVIAKMEKRGFIETVITQNIDNLHQQAGSKYVYELHGTLKTLVCTECSSDYDLSFADMNFLPPTCYICKGILKPDIVFFNEKPPHFAMQRSKQEATKSDVMIIIGAKGEVLPAAEIPELAKKTGSKIIEINIDRTHFTDTITDVFLQGKATEVLGKIGEMLYL